MKALWCSTKKRFLLYEDDLGPRLKKIEGSAKPGGSPSYDKYACCGQNTT
jgi:hypothetical protein